MPANLKPYPAYKPSGMEWFQQIPSHWEMNCLKRLVQVNPIGGRAKKEETVTFLPMEAVSTNGLIDGTRIERRANYPDSLTEFQRRDVILAKITPCFENGKGAYLESLQTGKGVGSTEFHVFRPDRSLLLPGFLYYLVTNGDFRNYATAFMEGSAGQKRVTTPFVSNCKFPIPPKQEQHRIATFLDQKTAEIDEAITKKQRLIELLKEQKAILINQAVTKGLNPNVPMRDSGVEWIGEVPAHWAVKKINWICSSIRDGTHNPPPATESEYRLLSVRNIVEGNFITRDDDRTMTESAFRILQRSYDLQVGDVVVALVGGTTGKSAVVKIDCEKISAQRSIGILRPIRRQIKSEYLNFAIQAPTLQKRIWEIATKYAAQPGIYLDDLARLKITCPALDEQKAIVDYLENIQSCYSTIIRKIEDEIGKLSQLKVILVAQAVTGKIKV